MIQIMLLGEATLSFTDDKNEINEISDSFAVLCTTLEEIVGRLEDINKTQVTKENLSTRAPLLPLWKARPFRGPVCSS